MKLLCLCLIACPTLRDAILEGNEFLRTCRDSSERSDLVIEKSTARFMLVHPPAAHGGDHLVMLYGLAFFHRLFGWLIGEEIPLNDLRVSIDHPLAWPSFRELFPCAIEPTTDINYLSFPSSYLDRPVIRRYHEVMELPPLFPFDLFPFDYGAQSLTLSVARVIDANLEISEELPALSDLAKMFGLTIPTLRRRLANEGTSMLKIRQECRQKLGMKLLLETLLSIDAIAEMLQFKDTVSFRRAFRSATGLTPSEYRRRRIK